MVIKLRRSTITSLSTIRLITINLMRILMMKRPPPGMSMSIISMMTTTGHISRSLTSIITTIKAIKSITITTRLKSITIKRSLLKITIAIA